jgi:hypothetical protein
MGKRQCCTASLVLSFFPLSSVRGRGHTMMNRQEEEQTGGWATNYQTEISRSPAVPYSTVMDSNNNSTPAKGQHCAGMPQLGNLKPKGTEADGLGRLAPGTRERIRRRTNGKRAKESRCGDGSGNRTKWRTRDEERGNCANK